MKSLIFVIAALAIFAAGDAFDPLAWCEARDYIRESVLFVANPENRTEFYRCDRGQGGFVVHKQSCQQCFEFDNDVWQCLKVSTCDAPTEVPITEVISYDIKYCYVYGKGAASVYYQVYRPGSKRYTYYWYIDSTMEIEMNCPPGTFFDQTRCKCVWCDNNGPCAEPSNRIFTLNFDSISAQNGIYFYLHPSITLVTGPYSQLAAEFDGSSSVIEVPYFVNNEFSQFTFVASVLRYAHGFGAQGILYNGGNPIVAEFSPPSIYIISQSYSKLVAGINTENGAFEITSSAAPIVGKWVSVILRYDGAKLELWVDDVYDVTPATGSTIRLKDVLKFGLSYDLATGAPQYFKGALDDLSWYQRAIHVPISDADQPPK